MTDPKIDLSEEVVVGTLLAGILSVKESIEVAQSVQRSGGLRLFDNMVHCELWRRIEAALKDGKPPNAYALIKQVEEVPRATLFAVSDNHVTGLMVEKIYLPELVAAAKQRRIRRAAELVLAGEEPYELKAALAEPDYAEPKIQSKADVAQAVIGKWEAAMQNPGVITGIDTGLMDLNRITWGWQPENFIVIGARPSKGKTAILIGFARAAAIENNVPTLFVTLESSITELTARLVCQITRSNQRRLLGGYATERDLAGLPRAFTEITKKPIHFMDCTGKSIGAIQAAIKVFVAEMGIKMVVVDYLQKIRPNTTHEKKTYEVAQASEGLKQLAKDCCIPVISAAQLNREPEKNKGRMPTLSDLSDSGQIERDADLVALIHAEGGEYTLLISKHRDGPIGSVPLHFTPECARFDNAGSVLI